MRLQVREEVSFWFSLNQNTRAHRKEKEEEEDTEGHRRTLLLSFW